MVLLDRFIRCIFAQILLLTCISAKLSTADFKENLVLKMLPKDYMLSSFNFKLKSDNIIASEKTLFDFKKHNGFSKTIEPLLSQTQY